MKLSLKKILAGAVIVPMMALAVVGIAGTASAIKSDAVTPAEITQEGTCQAAGGDEYVRPVYTTDPTTGNKTITTKAKCMKGKENLWVGSNDPTELVNNIINIFLLVVGILSVIFLIWGGLSYIMSRGDPKKVEAAKNTILYAIIGLVISLLAWAIVNWVFSTFVK
ncbi:pilin [Candidatus Saccharibacteria bacterium]|nr:pilin [Candidatus Saccharibacteria bacterium]MCL1963202.1 pilin [Candidatus Saccharibacteria bacterium]